MENEIHLISDGDGMAVIGESTVSTAVLELDERLGIDRGYDAVTSRRWVDAATDVKNRALEAGGNWADAASDAKDGPWRQAVTP